MEAEAREVKEEKGSEGERGEGREARGRRTIEAREVDIGGRRGESLLP